MQKNLPSNSRHLFFLVISILLTSLLFPSYAFASPSIASLKAKKQEVIRQLDRLDGELEEAVELYNEAVYKLSLTKKKQRKLQSEISSTEKEISVLEAKIARRARALYMLKTDPVVEALVKSESITDIITGLRMLTTVLHTEADLNAKLREKKAKLEKDRKELAAVLEQQKKLVKVAAQKKKAIEAKVKEKERILSSIDSQLRELIAKERERQRVAYSVPNYVSRGRTYVARGDDRSDDADNTGDASIGQRAVGIAYSLLGRPYRWGASGPGAFDCSGLTMYVYSRLGIYLPHSSSAQYYSGTRVSYDELRPGDLVFFARRSGRISHVGIYIGGGMMIHAPQTGDVVKIAPVSSHGGYVGAVRPY